MWGKKNHLFVSLEVFLYVLLFFASCCNLDSNLQLTDYKTTALATKAAPNKNKQIKFYKILDMETYNDLENLVCTTCLIMFQEIQCVDMKQMDVVQKLSNSWNKRDILPGSCCHFSTEQIRQDKGSPPGVLMHTPLLNLSFLFFAKLRAGFCHADGCLFPWSTLLWLGTKHMNNCIFVSLTWDWWNHFYHHNFHKVSYMYVFVVKKLHYSQLYKYSLIPVL